MLVEYDLCALSYQEEIKALKTEISVLRFMLESEKLNRCCGNCGYSVLLGESSMGCNGKNRRVIAQKNDPACEHWGSCRG